MQTNKPLYFTRDYVLTYDDSDMPTHYGFKIDSQLPAIEAEYTALLAVPRDQVKPAPDKPAAVTPALEQQTRSIITALDPRGGWSAKGALRFQKYEGQILDMATAVSNFNTLADYLAASRRPAN